MMMFAVLADAGSRKGPMVISGDQCSSMCSAMPSMPKLSQTSRISVLSGFKRATPVPGKNCQVEPFNKPLGRIQGRREGYDMVRRLRLN